jgi:hypothetical protein
VPDGGVEFGLASVAQAARRERDHDRVDVTQDHASSSRCNWVRSGSTICRPGELNHRQRSQLEVLGHVPRSPSGRIRRFLVFRRGKLAIRPLYVRRILNRGLNFVTVFTRPQPLQNTSAAG